MKRTCTTWTALVLAGALALPAASPGALAAGDSFREELASLINAQNTENYFDCMQLRMDSKILTMDGIGQIMDVQPKVQNWRTMLPIRPVAEAAGFSVDYEAETSTAIIRTSTGDEVRCPIGEDYIVVNGETVALDSPSYASDNRTYLPVRAIAEALDLQVDWNQMTQTVSISAPYQTGRILAWADEELDTSGLNAKKVLHDGSGFWVLQFETPAEAKAATQTLKDRGVAVQADAYLPPVDDAQNTRALSSGSSYHSWGVEDCSFDTFISDNASKLTGKGVVSVIDTGVDASHSFLKGRILPGYDFVDNDDDPTDEHYHGTHVAGTILDCCGDVDVSILPVRVLNKNGSGYLSTIIEGIKYAADQGADVINLSLGGTRNSNDTMDAAIAYAVEKGALVAVAAGNDGSNTDGYCPAHITSEGVVIVTAGDSDHNKAMFSNYGSNADVMAPGVGINASVPGDTFKNLNGTSMATPHVAAAGMLLDLATGKSLTPADLEKKLQSMTTGDDFWQDQYVGFGFLDLSKGKVDDEIKPPVEGYRFSVSKLNLEKGKTAQITVTAVFSDGTTKDVTKECQLTSADSDVASVDNNGIITAKELGTTLISMGVLPFEKIKVPRPIDVTVSTPQSEPDPDNAVFTKLFWALSNKVKSSVNPPISIAKDSTLQVDLIGEKENKDIVTLTEWAELYSSDESVLQISPTGELKAVGSGKAYIYYTYVPNVGLTLAPVLEFIVQ